ncbi:MAG: hypothetical protein AB7O28_23995 [Vicinamibacterales bacterium]
MRGALRIAGGALAALCALMAWRVSVLPRQEAAGAGLPATDVTVAYHVHSNRSDGTGTPDEIAAAAAAAGVTVVVLTDHGDGTRTVDPPRYLHGVLVVDAVEISTWGGHYVALGAAAAPYPLGGEPASVVDDVRWLGGLGVVAHPRSARDALRWRDWDAAFDGVEWLNADSEWRDRPRDLWTSLLTYPWRPVETLTALLDRPAAELAEWDRLATRRPVVGLAALDAHARAGLRGVGEPYDGWAAVRRPSYADAFATFTNVVRLDGPLSGDAPRDAAALLEALRAGRAYAVVTGQRAAGAASFTVEAGGVTWIPGAWAPPPPGLPIVFRAVTEAPPTATTRIVCDGSVVAESPGGRMEWTTATPPGACRWEVDLGSPFRTPWTVTNPVYVRGDDRRPDILGLPAATVRTPLAPGDPGAWHIERAPGTAADLEPAAGGGVSFRWHLGAGDSPYAAARVDLAPGVLTESDRIAVRGSADRPIRAWIQLRTPDAGGRRWGQSLRLEPGETGREFELPLERFLPLDGQAGPVPRGQVTALLVVVDTVHARPGTAGVLTWDGMTAAR